MQIIEVLAADATLDSTEKQCSADPTDGEELKNRLQTFPSWSAIVALFFGAIKGKPERSSGGWDDYHRLRI